MGPSYSIELVHGVLHYKSCGQGYENWNTEVISVTDKQWAKFRQSLDSLDIWRLKSEYTNHQVCDGTHWNLYIVYADRSIRSEGHNSYPGDEFTRPSGVRAPSVFKGFLDAVKSLLEGRDFQ